MAQRRRITAGDGAQQFSEGRRREWQAAAK
jgi:hypothetical protein